MQTGLKPVFRYGRVYLVVVMVLLMPVCSFAGIQLDFEWDPNPEPDIAGYRVFSRLDSENYDYDNPVWDGPDPYCSIWVEDENARHFFVVRAYDMDGFESEDSNEAMYDPGVSQPPEDPLPEDPPPEDPLPEDPPDEPDGDDPSNLLVVDTAAGNGQVYLYVDECLGVASMEEVSAIEEGSVPDTVKRPDDLFLGLFHFELIVETIGGIVSMPIYFSDPIDDDVRWYTYDDVNGWQDYSDYSTLSEDGMSMVLELKDGGYGDADGVENGMIVSTSGPGRDVSSSPGYSAAGPSPANNYSGCFIDSLSP